ncbi:unnamed protein product, partial [Polarella glacialis]
EAHSGQPLVHSPSLRPKNLMMAHEEYGKTHQTRTPPSMAAKLPLWGSAVEESRFCPTEVDSTASFRSRQEGTVPPAWTLPEHDVSLAESNDTATSGAPDQLAHWPGEGGGAVGQAARPVIDVPVETSPALAIRVPINVPVTIKQAASPVPSIERQARTMSVEPVTRPVAMPVLSGPGVVRHFGVAQSHFTSLISDKEPAIPQAAYGRTTPGSPPRNVRDMRSISPPRYMGTITSTAAAAANPSAGTASPWAAMGASRASRSVSPQPRFTQMQGVPSAGGQPPQWTMSQPTMSWPSQQQYPAWQQPPSGVASRSASPTPGQPGAAGGDSRYLLSVGPSRSVSPQPGSPFGGRSPWGAQPVQGGRTAVPHPRSVSPMQRVGGLATPVGYLSQGGGFGLLGQSNTPGVPAPAALPLQPGASGSTTPQGYFSSLRGRPGSFGLPLSQAGAGVGGVPCPNPMPCGQRLGGGYGNQFGAAPSPMSLLLARGHPGQPGGPCSQPAVAASPSNRVSPNGAMERFVVRQASPAPPQRASLSSL